jgi:hypothetical protein
VNWCMQLNNGHTAQQAGFARVQQRESPSRNQSLGGVLRRSPLAPAATRVGWWSALAAGFRWFCPLHTRRRERGGSRWWKPWRAACRLPRPDVQESEPTPRSNPLSAGWVGVLGVKPSSSCCALVRTPVLTARRGLKGERESARHRGAHAINPNRSFPGAASALSTEKRKDVASTETTGSG